MQKPRILASARKYLSASGAVSPECAQAMAEGIREASGSDIAGGHHRLCRPRRGTPLSSGGHLFVAAVRAVRYAAGAFS